MVNISDFDAFCKYYAQGVTDPERLANIKQSNNVVRIFTAKYVLKNREELENDTDLFRCMIQAYLNIFDYNHSEKPQLRNVLENLFVSDKLVNKIMTLSKPGRYRSLSRTLIDKYDAYVRSMFLDVVEAFYAPQKDYSDDQLYEKMEVFATDSAAGGRNFGPAVLSGLAAALHPKKFMVYNSISADILCYYDTYAHLASSRHITKYREFNNLHRAVAKKIKRPLVELDATISPKKSFFTNIATDISLCKAFFGNTLSFRSLLMSI